MPCLLVLLVVAFPRVVLALLFFLSDYLQTAYHSLLMILLGFIFLPLTTLVYAWMVHSAMAPLQGVNLIILIIAVVIDLGGLGGGEYHRRRRW